MELPEQTPSYVSLHLSTKGKYTWDIKLNLTEKEIQHSPVNLLVDKFKQMDAQLRQQFPNNTAEMKNTSKFGGFSEE